MRHKILLTLILIFTITCTDAQNVGIGTSSPGAMLDVYATNGGILIPRVALTGTGSYSPLTSLPTTSTLVYNTATIVSGATSVSPGFYYWNVSAWVRVIDNASIGGATTVSNTSSTNTLSTTVNGVTGTTVPIINSISNTSSANTLSTTVNGVTGTGVNIINSSALSLSGNTLTSTVNGVAPTQSLSGLSLSGDVTGTLAAPTVAAIQGKPVSATTPTSGQVLEYIGSTWTPTSPGSSLFTAGTGLGWSGSTLNNTGVTSVATGSGLTGGPITTTGTIGIATGGITNAMLANSTVNYPVGSGLTGGGSISLGGTATTIGIATGGITNAMLANSTISGVALGGNLNALTIGTGLSGTSYNGSSAVTIANTGVTSAVAGTGIGVSGATGAVTISNTGVTSIVAGSGISISGGTGAVTLTNSAQPAANTITGSGTTNYHAKFTGANTIGNSLIYDNGSAVGIGTTTLSNLLTIDGTTPIVEIRSGGYLMLRPAANGWDMRLEAVSQRLDILSGGSLGTPIMSLLNGGNVGIGTISPGFPLDVEITAPETYSNYGACYAGGSGATFVASVQTTPVSIHASGRMTCTEFDAISDKRIKDIIGISDPSADLMTLNKIEVTDFKYKDKVQHGDHTKKGFIAQQVETVFSEAINKQTGFIPDIYAMSESSCFDADMHTLTITLTKPHNLSIGDKVKIITAGERKEVIVDNIISGTQFSVGGWDKPTDTVFVYGREVNDFRVVDYDRIYTLNVSATQQLSKKLEEAQARIDLLTTENARLRSTTDHQSEMMQNMKAQIDAINERLNIRTDRQ